LHAVLPEFVVNFDLSNVATLANDILQELGRGYLQLIFWSFSFFLDSYVFFISLLELLYLLVILVSLFLLSLVSHTRLRAIWRPKRGMTLWGDFF
jgi:hypothetical protein